MTNIDVRRQTVETADARLMPILHVCKERALERAAQKPASRQRRVFLSAGSQAHKLVLSKRRQEDLLR